MHASALHPDALGSLADRAALHDLVARFANAFDVQDWPRLRGCLADALHTDYAALRGTPPRVESADDYVAARAAALAGLRTLHLLGNVEVTVDGNAATVVAAFTIQRRAGDTSERFDTTGHYRFGCERVGEPAAWRIAAIRQTLLWSEGAPSLHGALREPAR